VKTCPYCGSNLKPRNKQQYACDFCSMTFAVSEVKENRERLEVRFYDFALEGYIDWTTPELMTLSTFELLCLLKILRKKRNEMYHLLLNFYRAGEQESNKEWKDYEKVAGREYLYITKKGKEGRMRIRTQRQEKKKMGDSIFKEGVKQNILYSK
jgi:hypothetical protein